MLNGPEDLEDLLEESIYDEIEEYYDDDLVGLAQTNDWD